jgi:hypothetical protein
MARLMAVAERVQDLAIFGLRRPRRSQPARQRQESGIDVGHSDKYEALPPLLPTERG